MLILNAIQFLQNQSRLFQNIKTFFCLGKLNYGYGFKKQKKMI